MYLTKYYFSTDSQCTLLLSFSHPPLWHTPTMWAVLTLNKPGWQCIITLHVNGIINTIFWTIYPQNFIRAPKCACVSTGNVHDKCTHSVLQNITYQHKFPITNFIKIHWHAWKITYCQTLPNHASITVICNAFRMPK